MTAFAINSGGVEYYDQKTGGSVNATLDTYTISNGSTLIVRTDSYACANHSAAFGSIDNIAFSGIGGEVVIDPTYVRHVAYTGGSGNSPAFGAAISQGGVSGVFLGVWANWQSEPIVPGAAIPATGFIKIGGVAGGAFSAGALTGIAATCAGADVQSWIEVRSAETATINVPRVGKFSTVEAWLELGVTTGSAGQVIPCPTTNTVAQVWGGAWIETAPGSNIYDRFWGAAGQVALSTTPTDVRAKQIWQTTAGLVLGFDGTNNVGFLPPAGCKIKIPAVILTNCTRSSGNGSGPRVLPHATIATRAKFTTSLSGDIDLRGVVSQWYCNFNQPFALKIEAAIISSSLNISEVIGARINECIVSAVQSQNSVIPLAASYCIDLKIENSCFARFALSITNDNIFSLYVSENVEINNVTVQSLTDRVASTNAFRLASNINTVVDSCVQIGARLLTQNCVGTTIKNCLHADRLVATTTANSQNAYHSAVSTNIVIENCGPIPGIANIHPYGSWVYIESSRGGVVRNFGSYAAPIDCGSANAAGYGFDMFAAPQNLKLQRCYFVNTRTGLFTIANETNGLLIEHCYGDYADTTVIECLNSTIRSCGFLGNTAGMSSVYGTHWSTQFTSATAGIINLMCNEPTAQTAGQCTVVSGAPKFNSSGSILMTVVGQQVVFEMPYFALGNTALANSAVALRGTNTANLTYEFQYDLGSGYNGSWLTANATNFTGVGSIDPAIGIKIKLRVTCVTANAGNNLTNIRINTVTTSTAQSENLYPLSYAPISVSGLTAGSRVKFSKVSDGSILYSAQEVSGVVNFNSNEYVGAVSIEARNASAPPYYLPWVTQVVTVDGQTTTAIALQQLD